MESRIIVTNKEEVNTILIWDKNDTRIVKLNGFLIDNWNDYIVEISNLLDFPYEDSYGKDAYIDWMRDLSWFLEKYIIIIIYNYDEFMKNSYSDKKEFLKMFEEDILPRWNGTMKIRIKDATKKTVIVYLVE
ncbi:barstar family protein [Fusobacterium sp. PH5-44]|uniref:barstar family protein n=1 Tax=unclassified Fusobacterium TaxID=2648384 RepID=UPI003D218E99